MMMVIITRYPASEDRLIVRPLLSRVCALRLQPAEPQPYIRASMMRSGQPDGSVNKDFNSLSSNHELPTPGRAGQTGCYTR